MDRLPSAFFCASLRTAIRFGAEVFAVDQDADAVTVHFQTAAGPRTRVGRLLHLHAPVRASCATSSL